jgi:hypothetical protein
LTVDPYELKNIAYESAAADALLKMQEELRKQLADTNGK